jgi:hypothetical protein
VEGKVQNAWGKAKDAVKKPNTNPAEDQTADNENEEEQRRRDRAANE